MKKIISRIIVISLIAYGGFMYLEPQLINGGWNFLFVSPTDAAATSTTVTLTVTGEIQLSCSSTVALLPDILGQTGGTATGTFGCLVTTNNSGGYNMKIEKNQKLQFADVADQRFDDYATTAGPTDWNWDTVAVGAEEFGFEVHSAASTTDISTIYKDNGAVCGGAGTAVASWRCWNSIPTTPATAATVANRGTATPAVGVWTRFGLQAQAGGSNSLVSGGYVCTTTVTAVTN